MIVTAEGRRLLVRVLRRLTLDEVRGRIDALEKRQGMTFEEFEELYLEKRVDRTVVDAYFEWASLVDAYRGYVEGGELDYTVEEIQDLNPKEVALLTPKRVELLYGLAGLRVKSINDLAQRVHRDVKNVYQDLQALKKLGFVTFKRKGKRNLVPEILVEEITFLVR